MFEDDKMIFHCPACFKVDSIKLEGLLNVLKILRQKSEPYSDSADTRYSILL